MRFYIYRQNNSGGDFIVNDTVAHYVFIEADTDEAADAKAKQVGIYFDGIEQGWDCACCGDRWHRSSRYDYTDRTYLYDVPVEHYDDAHTRPGQPYAYVYYKDGSKVAHIKPART